MQAAQTAKPTLNSFIDWSQGVRWEALPGVARAMVKQELLDFDNLPDAMPFLVPPGTLELE